MKLLEYEAKTLLRSADVDVPASTLITKTTDPLSIKTPVVLKSQVPVGGRGKLGGVVVVDQPETLEKTIDDLFSLAIKGHTPSVLLAEEKINIKDEHYLSLLIDLPSASIRLIAHNDGGIEVEDNDSAEFLNIAIDEESIPRCAEQLARYLRYEATAVHPVLKKLFLAFVQNDATLIEINPLIVTTDDVLICGDCKMELDDMAAFRHPEWDFQERPRDTNFVTLDKNGQVATIANGAGLAMSTVDAVASAGMSPANFLDIGGGASTESVLAAFRRIVEFPDIQVIVINIFAGITRCDEVARAIIEAKKQIDDLPPLCIRLAGTNFEEAVALLSHEGIVTLATLEECLTKAEEITHA